MSKIVSSRRGFLFGLGAALAAPAIVKAANLMPVRAYRSPVIRPIFYSNRTIRRFVDIETIRDMNVLLRPDDYVGQPIVNFRNVPIITAPEAIAYGRVGLQVEAW
jgi:hypothetical protein